MNETVPPLSLSPSPRPSSDYAPRDDTHEATPLVPPTADAKPAHRRRLTVLLLCSLLTVVADFGGGLTATPEVRLFETAVCRAYYAQNDPSVIGPPPFGYVDERLCKKDEIQVSLAYLRAWKRLFDTVPGETEARTRTTNSTCQNLDVFRPADLRASLTVRSFVDPPVRSVS